MVKYLSNTILFLVIAGIFCLLNCCNVDLLGFFSANDLDERLKERNNFKFINENGGAALTLYSDYSFIVLADPHIENGNAWGLERLSDVIKANTDIKFVVILGDITQYGSEKDINTFIKIAELLTVPCYPVIGNHDVYFDNWSIWKEKIGSTSYKINAGNTTLFIIDSANSFFGQTQLDWLEREIKSTSGHVFVFTHSSLFVTGPADMQQITDTKERARIVSILRNKCDIMFMGHLHKRLYNEAGNVKYVTVEDFKSAKTYCLVSVTSTGVTYNFKNL